MSPVRGGIVSTMEDYIYSSGRTHCNGTGTLEIALIEIPKVNTLKPSFFEEYIR
ncbi:hypothetical protein [Flavobacterium sp.]|jgi:hypothetical protein|uniref:hypothetical protein n=1 Tax=Flavobacterium sp. TaxID=239 RepID=UPI0022C59D97|nr:hypothetical protein [Flavobacterium sp.]MCZ8145584.1 hypothetical protein [Flavobacterium sp.]MCZ8366535.1 hypothetical protein [Flavobacterium sp.]